MRQAEKEGEGEGGGGEGMKDQVDYSTIMLLLLYFIGNFCITVHEQGFEFFTV